MPLRLLLLAVLVAVVAEISAWRDIEPDGLAALAYTASGLGLLAVGALAGRRGMVVVVPAFILTALAEEAWVYEPPVPYNCDPFCSSPATSVVMVPPLLFLMLVGMAGGALVKRVAARCARRAAAGEQRG